MRVTGFVSDRHAVVHYTQIKCMLEVVAVVSVVLLVVAVVVVIVGAGNVVDVGFAGTHTHTLTHQQLFASTSNHPRPSLPNHTFLAFWL